MTKGISFDDLKTFEQTLSQTPASDVIARSVQQNGIAATSINHAAKKDLNRVFSVEVPTNSVTYQKQSGRCWLFSTLNTLRHDFEQKYKVKDFQFSQNYNSFYDRLEKANKMLEEAIALVDRPNADREYLALLEWGNGDGGQWANGPALINKYGVVPQSVMPETYNSDATKEISQVLNLKLRKEVVALRDLAANGADETQLRDHKKVAMSDVYRMLVYAFGQPPKTFDFEYRDEDKVYHVDRDLTPQTFFQKYVAVDFDDYVVLMDAPDHNYGVNYGMPSQDYVFEGKKIELANVGLKAMKEAVIAALKDGQTVWFGCDVSQDMDRKDGILDTNYFKKSDLFSVDLSLSKADRLATRDGAVTHAMTMVGVDLIDDKPVKWKVENSWGDKFGDKGYFIMSDDWFNTYLYEVVVNKKYVDEKSVKVAQQAPEDVTAWDSLV